MALAARLGTAEVLSDIDLRLRGGDWLAVVGPNGAGKSTLLRLLAGLLTPSAGEVLLDDVPLRELSPRQRARRIGYLPQSPVMPAGLTVTEYALLGRTPFHSLLSAPGRDDRVAVTEVLARLELTPLAGRRLGTLSGGERQRAALARVLAQRPRLMLLDEPTAALDLGHAQQVLEDIDRIRREDGTTVVTTVHDLVLAGQYAHPVAMLAAGRLVGFGPPEEVLTGATLAEHYGASAQVEHGPTGVRIHPLRRPPLRSGSAPG